MVVKPDHHYTKAEENYFFGMQYCSGRYVWILGDDDPPNRSGVRILLSAIKEGNFGLMVFDCNKSLISGELRNGALSDTSSEVLGTLGDFLKRFGFWYTIAGFSNAVFKNPSKAEYEKSKAIMAISPIYSHVFWLVTVFWNKPFLFSPTPLVCYSESRRDANDSDLWPKLAKQEGVFATYYWTLGFVRQIKYLRKEINLPTGWLCDVWDVDWGGSRNPVLNKVCFIFWHEIVVKPRIARAATSSEVKEVSDFLIEENPKFEYFASYLCKYDYEPSKLEANRVVLDSFTQAILDNPIFDYYVGNHCGFLLFCLHGRYFALHNSERRNSRTYLSESVFFDQELFYSAASLEELKFKIDRMSSDNGGNLRTNIGAKSLTGIERRVSRMEAELANRVSFDISPRKTAYFYIKKLIPRPLRTWLKKLIRGSV